MTRGMTATKFLVFLPNGKALEIPAAAALVEQDRETGLIRAITAQRPDGTACRYEGFPVAIEAAAEPMVEPVTAMPKGLVSV